MPPLRLVSQIWFYIINQIRVMICFIETLHWIVIIVDNLFSSLLIKKKELSAITTVQLKYGKTVHTQGNCS